MSTNFSSVRQTSTDYLERFGEDLLAALLYPFQSVLRAILALILAGLTFVVLILAAQSLGVLHEIIGDPMIIVNSKYIEFMFFLNLNHTLNMYGWTPIVMNVAYALLTGIALTNMVAQLRMLQVGSISSIGGIIPGLFAAGCASCGPGLFALLGVTGAITFIPFQGLVLRLAGIGMFLFFLGLSGDPRECRID
jgi:hypothetical protein